MLFVVAEFVTVVPESTVAVVPLSVVFDDAPSVVATVTLAVVALSVALADPPVVALSAVVTELCVVAESLALVAVSPLLGVVAVSLPLLPDVTLD